MHKCNIEIAKLKFFLDVIAADKDKLAYIYGASTKGNCLLQYAGIGPQQIKYAVERNPLKVGCMTSTQIPIISEETMRNDPPSYQLVLPWHFRTEIIDREKDYLQQYGQFIFPLPKFEIYSHKPKVLITGIHGQIAHYVIQVFKDKYQIYGIAHNKSVDKKFDTSITTLYFDIRDKNKLEQALLTINPDFIVHLAGNSQLDPCEEDFLDTLNINGLVTVNICDIVHRHQLKSRLFNASSLFIYEGHSQDINDDTSLINPQTAYTIAKSIGHQTVNYYRQTYNHHFSNGILCTTESQYRSPNFLLKKVADHARTWSLSKTILELYNFDEYRNIIHAHDVATAIQLILEQPASNYFIGSDNFIHLYDLVIHIYEHHGIELYFHDNTFYEQLTNSPVIQIKSQNRRHKISLNGNSTKLKSLGWYPHYTLHDIITDL